MNYRNVASLEGSTLQVGDLVGICAIGHLVRTDNLENLGGCGDLWIFGELEMDLDEADGFCRGITPEVWIDFGNDEVCFKSLEFLTLVVLELMRLSEKQGYDKDFSEEL